MKKDTKDIMISVRMPSTLLVELKTLSKQHHYLDVSEAIRSIIRSKCMDFLDPYASEMSKFRKELKKDLLNKTKSKQDLIKDLKRITEELANEL
jgi:metal-responsive CopG/Arc/MetJ family transcriptional regulator